MDIKRSKAVDVRFHYVREKVADGVVSVTRVHTSVQLADVLTKVLGQVKMKFFWAWGRGGMGTHGHEDGLKDQGVNTLIQM